MSFMNFMRKPDQVAWTPERAHNTDAGLDLRSTVETTICPGCAETIDLHIAIQIPHGHFGAIRSRSSMFRKGIITDGTIDEGYTGTIKVVLRNLTQFDQHIHIGDKIAQLVIIPCRYDYCKEVDKLEKTDRGAGGFGSTGR